MALGEMTFLLELAKCTKQNNVCAEWQLVKWNVIKASENPTIFKLNLWVKYLLANIVVGLEQDDGVFVSDEMNQHSPASISLNCK